MNRNTVNDFLKNNPMHFAYTKGSSYIPCRCLTADLLKSVEYKGIMDFMSEGDPKNEEELRKRIIKFVRNKVISDKVSDIAKYLTDHDLLNIYGLLNKMLYEDNNVHIDIDLFKRTTKLIDSLESRYRKISDGLVFTITYNLYDFIIMKSLSSEELDEINDTINSKDDVYDYIVSKKKILHNSNEKIINDTRLKWQIIQLYMEYHTQSASIHDGDTGEYEQM